MQSTCESVVRYCFGCTLHKTSRTFCFFCCIHLFSQFSQSIQAANRSKRVK